MVSLYNPVTIWLHLVMLTTCKFYDPEGPLTLLQPEKVMSRHLERHVGEGCRDSTLKGKPPKCVSAGRWKSQSCHTAEYQTVMKKDNSHSPNNTCSSHSGLSVG